MIYDIIVNDVTYRVADPKFFVRNNRTPVETTLSFATAVEFRGELYQIRGKIPYDESQPPLPMCSVGIRGIETPSIESIYNAQAETDNLILDHEERLILLEVGE